MAEEVIAAPKNRRISPAMLRDAEEAIALGQTLWQPQAVYKWIDVRQIAGERAILSSPNGVEAVLHVGPKADLLSPAQRVLVSLVSLGPALEQKVGELQAEGHHMKAYLLDSAGVAALGAVAETLRCLVEDTARELGWGVGPSLSPGSLVGWSLRGQRELCALLPLDEIGVRLNEHCVLEPHKSVSGLVGLGPEYELAHVGSICKYCALQKTCWRRREDPA
jgi:hypothetical protein